MITLTAKIELLSGINNQLSLGLNNLSGNNISSDINNVIANKKYGSNPFIIGASKLGDGSTFSRGVDYFIGNKLSDKNGDFEIPYEFVLNCSSGLTIFIISFDKTNNRYPTKIIVDDKEYANTDSIFTVSFESGLNSHKIIISNWNTPNYPLIITGVYVETTIVIDYKNLISISRRIFDRSDLKLPSFGIISNTGSIEFNDINSEVLDYAEQLLLQNGLKCKIQLKNTLVEEAIETIGLFETDQWNYDNDSKVVSVTIKDDLEEWQNINVKSINYDPREAESKPFKWLYEYLWGLTDIRVSGNYNMQSFNELDSNTQNVLLNTYIKYPLLESGSLWQQWTKLCQVCQLHIYKNNQGIVVCRYNGGN